MTLTQDQIDFFFANGYLVHGPLLGPDELEALRDAYDHEFERAEQGGRFRNLSTAADTDVATQKTAPVRMLQIIQMSERSLAFRKLLYDERILDVVQDLIGPNLMLFHDQALFKPAFQGGPIHWHQDNAYWQCSPPTLVSCWITLDDVDRENGAMQVIPGSHLRPVRHAGQEGDPLLKMDEAIDESQAVCVDLPAGGCMFHHCQTLHYTQPNTTPRQRRAFAIHYMQPGTSRLGETLHVGYSHPMLRLRM